MMNKLGLYCCAMLSVTLLFGCHTQRSTDAANAANQAEKTLQEQQVVHDLNNQDTLQAQLNEPLLFHRKAQAENWIKIEVPQTENYQIKLEFTDSLANLRLTQIFLPDGTADGPFGNEYTTQLLKGTYYFRLTENQMAGDPWEGEARFIIRQSAR